MKNKIFFAIIFFIFFFLVFTAPLVQASLIENIWYNTLSFLGIIEITRANHLNSDGVVISDIYNEVKELDNIWSETIPDGDYVRVTFEKKLTSRNDITIYPRVTSGEPRIEVYEKDSDIKIVEFSSLNSNQYNKIYLTNLIREQDVFDLHVIGGSIEFDHIIDPTTITQVGTSADCKSNDTCTACTIANIQTNGDALTCTMLTPDAGEIGYLNITHVASIPAGSTISEVWACTDLYTSGTKAGDEAGDRLVIEVGHNATGTMTWQTEVDVSGTGVDAYDSEAVRCWNVTTLIDTLEKASSVRIKGTYYETADNNQGFTIDYSYVNITYTTLSTCTCPGLNNNWEINLADYCIISTGCNLGTGTLNFTGSGNVTCSANINTTNLGDVGATGIMYIASNCNIRVS